MACRHPRQAYFKTTLPCAVPDCSASNRGAPICSIAVMTTPTPCSTRDLDLYAVPAVRVMFHRAWLTDNPSRATWIPDRCIDRFVDANLTERLIAAGLEGALIGEAPGPQPGGTPHFHGIVMLNPGEEPPTRCPGCVYQRGGGPNSYYGVDRSVAPALLTAERAREMLENGWMTTEQVLRAMDPKLATEIEDLKAEIADAQARAATPLIGAPIRPGYNVVLTGLEGDNVPPLTEAQIEAGLQNTRDAMDALARAGSSVAKEPGVAKPDPWVETCDPLHWIPDA